MRSANNSRNRSRVDPRDQDQEQEGAAVQYVYKVINMLCAHHTSIFLSFCLFYFLFSFFSSLFPLFLPFSLFFFPSPPLLKEYENLYNPGNVKHFFKFPYLINPSLQRTMIALLNKAVYGLSLLDFQ